MDLNLWVMSKSLMCPFDKMIKEGKIPKGKKRQGFKELSWTKEQLNNYKLN